MVITTDVKFDLYLNEIPYSCSSFMEADVCLFHYRFTSKCSTHFSHVSRKMAKEKVKCVFSILCHTMPCLFHAFICGRLQSPPHRSTQICFLLPLLFISLAEACTCMYIMKSFPWLFVVHCFPR